MTTTDITIGDIRTLLTEAVAAEVGITPAEVETDQPFTYYELDSVAALSVSMELEDHCRISDLPADLLWDYPTVDALAVALWERLNPGLAAAAVDGK
ncbi:MULTISPECIES: acyl carrier protein [unclassified Streptomyces]|uniref:acyl carrier protein n=1 Tax=unclassified Streptomyces TaxID=2593676 RepID=UPI00278C0BDC|nr:MULTISPECIES: acyl carrier protein [unclassified Streptomyces]